MKMIGPSSQISKLLLGLLFLLVCFYLFMDLNLYMRIHDYPLEPTSTGGGGGNATPKYEDVTWVSCHINPLCLVTVKAVLLDHTNYYLFAPLVQLADDLLDVSGTAWITPDAISVFHIFVAVLSAKAVSSNCLAHRRVGVALFEFRTWLDDLDGHVARARRHVLGERSEVGTAGYYVDGACDAAGVTALVLGVLVFLRNNPSRRGYVQLPTEDGGAKGATSKVVRKVGCFSLQLVASSVAWNRYIAVYQEFLEGGPVEGRREVFRSGFFFVVAWLWRVVNIHSLTHLLLLSIFCDKLWEFLRSVQYVGFGVLFLVVCITEINVVEVRNFLDQIR